MKVGDEIRVFEITENGQKIYTHAKELLTGKQLAEDVDSLYYGNKFGVDLVDRRHYNFSSMGMARHVATMRITKLK